MKYYLIVGEASGDLHASHLMMSLKKEDKEADFRFFGGDLMERVGGTQVKHYKELAYMGFGPVLLHLRTIFRNMAMCKQDIVSWHPDVVILVDYPGFNLNIAKYLKQNTSIPVYYYISPKIWAWKEYRIKNIKRDIDHLFSILPFEVPFLSDYCETFGQFIQRNRLDDKPIIALLAGSRKQEIKGNLPEMIQVAEGFGDYQMVLAGAPSIDDDYYAQFIKGTRVKMVHNDTYALLSHATVALVTSGTATLETALFNVPQVVCYATPLPRIYRFGFNHILKVKYISLVNLIADKEVVKELFADRFKVDLIREELNGLFPGSAAREEMLAGYEEVHRRLGDAVAPDNAARIIYELLLNNVSST